MKIRMERGGAFDKVCSPSSSDVDCCSSLGVAAAGVVAEIKFMRVQGNTLKVVMDLASRRGAICRFILSASILSVTEFATTRPLLNPTAC